MNPQPHTSHSSHEETGTDPVYPTTAAQSFHADLPQFLLTGPHDRSPNINHNASTPDANALFGTLMPDSVPSTLPLGWNDRRALALSLCRDIGKSTIAVDRRLQLIRTLMMIVHVVGMPEITAVKTLLDDLNQSPDALLPGKISVAFFFLLCAEYASTENARVVAFKIFISNCSQDFDRTLIEKAVTGFAQKTARLSHLKAYADFCTLHNRTYEASLLCTIVAWRESAKNKRSPHRTITASDDRETEHTCEVSTGTQPPASDDVHTTNKSIVTSLTDHIIGKQTSFSRIEDSQQLTAILELLKREVAESDLRHSSKRVYLSRINRFAAFINSQPIDTAGSENYLSAAGRSFIRHLQDDFHSPHTLRNLNFILRLIAQVTGDIIDWPMVCSVVVAKQKKQKSKLRTLTLQEQDLLVNECRMRSPRALTLVLLFLNTDVRFVECSELLVSDICQTDSKYKLHIGRHTTGSRYEMVNDQLEGALDAWLTERAKKFGNSGYLFPNQTGGKLSRSSIDFTIKQSGNRCGLKLCYRTLRQTYLLARANSPGYEF